MILKEGEICKIKTSHGTEEYLVNLGIFINNQDDEKIGYNILHIPTDIIKARSGLPEYLATNPVCWNEVVPRFLLNEKTKDAVPCKLIEEPQC